MFFLRRSLATSATADALAIESDSGSPAKEFKIMSGVILSRPPIITPEQTAFSKAYYHYQSELYKRMSWTFPYWFYYPKGTLAENEYTRVQPKLNEKDPDVLFNRDRNSKQDVVFPPRSVQRETEESARIYAKIVPNPRTTIADEENNIRSLERKLDRTLYLIVKRDGESLEWSFPATTIESGENLESSSTRMLAQYGGEDMNIFLVSGTPALYYKDVYESDGKYEGAKV